MGIWTRRRRLAMRISGLQEPWATPRDVELVEADDLLRTGCRPPPQGASCIADPSRFCAPTTARGGRRERRRGMCTGCSWRLLSARTKYLQIKSSCSPAGRPPAGLAGATSCGDYRVRAACCGDSRGSLVRDVRGIKRSRRSFAPNQSTQHADLQGFLRERRDSNPRPPA
jgi:hypothetical protein